ncbi:MAG TPA: M48 family metalloprotease [Ideonella sp.]|nr:M48 family metalloprotease [Ideonella sp.]
MALIPSPRKSGRLAPRSFGLSCLAAALWLAWPAVVPEARAQQRLPALGDSVSADFDITEERRLGERIMREIRRDPDYLDDPLLLEYLNALWQPLVAAARARGEITADNDTSYAWEAFLIRDRMINAFALPGGYVGVYLGLIALTGSGDELASVLGHELSHVTQRHIARGMVNSKNQSLLALGGMILGMIAASRASSSDAAQAVIAGSQAAMVQGQLNFSRDMEREADRIGLDLMATAGFSPTGMAGMFEKLDGASRLNDSNQYPYLRSHPLTVERISEARLRAREAAPLNGRDPVTLTQHTLMQARARVLMDRSEPSLRRQQALGAPGSPAVDLARVGALYSSGMASTQLREFDRADQAIDAGMAIAARNFAGEPAVARAFALLKAANQIERGGSATAMASVLGSTLAPYAADRSRPMMMARAQAALARQRAGDAGAATELRSAMESLQTWVSEHRRDSLAWLTLSQCAEPLGLRLRSLRAGAEAAASSGDLLGAVDRLRAAQQIARGNGSGDDVEISIIQSRLRELEPERRKLLAEMRGEKPE